MGATNDAQLAAVVLGAGAYDGVRWSPTGIHGLDATIRQEAGPSAEALRARSALDQADKLKAPVLWLHGAWAERIAVRQTDALAETLNAHGVAVPLTMFPHATPRLPMAEHDPASSPLLEPSLRASVCAGRPRQWSRVTGSTPRLIRAQTVCTREVSAMPLKKIKG
jgi:dienelactone hydrolase